MTEKFYSYSLSTILAKAVGWFMALFCVVTLLMAIIEVLTSLAQHQYSQEGLLQFLGLILGMLFGLLVCLNVTNSFANIWTNEQEIRVQFMWWYIPIPWDEIIAVNYYGFAGARHILVKARHISWFHYTYGISYPAFVIYSSIEGYSELVHEIESHCKVKGK